MSAYRVTFYSLYRLANGKADTRTIWVEANNEHHAVAAATMLTMTGTGNADAEQIREWFRAGVIHNVYAVIETN